jgi:hypothetical protein
MRLVDTERTDQRLPHKTPPSQHPTTTCRHRHHEPTSLAADRFVCFVHLTTPALAGTTTALNHGSQTHRTFQILVILRWSYRLRVHVF